MRNILARLKPKKEEIVQPDSIRFEGDYPSYEAALADCRGSAGYESAPAIERYVRRYREVVADPAKAILDASDQVLRFMAAFSVAKPIDGVYRVYDFGGGYGAIYELFRFLYPDARFHWTIVEVPALVARAGEMGASSEKVFATDIPAGPYSLGISSGTLQCLPDPVDGLARMISAEAGVTFLNRFPMHTGLASDRLAVQHVPANYFEASFPVWFFSPNWKVNISSLGSLIAEWNSPGDVVKLDAIDVAYSAFLFRA